MLAEAEDGVPGCDAGNDNTQDEGSMSIVICSKVTELKSEIRKVKKQKSRLLKAKAREEGKFSRLFRPIQLQELSGVNMKGVQWSLPSVKKAFQLRFACGSSDYNVFF